MLKSFLWEVKDEVICWAQAYMYAQLDGFSGDSKILGKLVIFKMVGEKMRSGKF